MKQYPSETYNYTSVSNFHETNDASLFKRREKQNRVVVVETKGVTIAH